MLPRCEHVDYGEYSNIPRHAGNLFAKRYKDGILLVAHDIGRDMWPGLTLGISELS